MDSRTKLEKWLWDVIGPPLYYCETCKKQVDVKTAGGEVTIKRFCEHDSQVIAPRTALVSGKGFAGLSMGNKVKSVAQRGAASLTGRCV